MIHGLTDDMAAFRPRQLELATVAREAVPGRCAGGMLGCPPFQAADDQSTTALTTYLTAADRELVRVREIAVACADDYVRGDGTGAQSLVQARDAAPAGPGQAFSDATRVHLNPRLGPGGDLAARV